MKTILIINLLWVLTIGCSEQPRQTDLKVERQDTVPQKSTNHEFQCPLPLWCMQIIKKVTPPTHPDNYIDITDCKRKNDSILFILYEIKDDVSLTKYLMSFIYGQYKEHEVIERVVDQDFSITHYEYKELIESDGNNFIVSDYQQTVIDKSVLGEDTVFFKPGFNFENVKLKTDTTKFSLTVMEDGNIKRDTIK